MTFQPVFPHEPTFRTVANGAHARRLRSLRTTWVGVAHGQGRRWQAGGFSALLGTALASLAIAVLRHVFPVEELSLLYLLVVLWLAIRFGWWEAAAASCLAVLTYDFLFIPPLYRLTVNDPMEWTSLFALLTVALAISQLAARAQRDAHAAIDSAQRTTALYTLAQLTASLTEPTPLAAALSDYVMRIFSPAGVVACAVVVPDAQGHPITLAVAPARTPFAEELWLRVADCARLAAIVLVSSCSQEVAADHPPGARNSTYIQYFLPLRAHDCTVGILALVGTPQMRELFSGEPRLLGQNAEPAPTHRDTRATAELFVACRDQIALAFERAMLRQQAIHAEALRESDYLKDVLLSSVSHELQTPLAAIKAAAGSLAASESWLTPAMHVDLLEVIETSTNRLMRLVSNLLDFSRLEAGAGLPVKDWHLIGEVIATVLDRLDVCGQLSAHQVVIDLAENLPLALMDHTQIEQVLTNLVENAAKYSPAGSRITVCGRGCPSPPTLMVSVSDQGIGIPRDKVAAVFDRFYRIQQCDVPGMQRPPTGTGLGLAICAAIIAAHDGRIWAESPAGMGTTITFTLPLSDDQPTGALPELIPDGVLR